RSDGIPGRDDVRDDRALRPAPRVTGGVSLRSEDARAVCGAGVAEESHRAVPRRSVHALVRGCVGQERAMKLDRGKSCLRFKGEGPAAEEGGFEDRRQSRGKAERDPQVRCEEGREEKDVVPGFPEERRRLMRPSEGIIFMLQQLALIALGSALTLCAVALATAQEAPSTMKAIRMHEFGGPETLRLEEAPVPTPAPGEVLVRVYAAGV